VTRAPRVLFVDNFDSFSYNVVHLLASRGAAPDVLLNDDPRLEPGILDRYDALVVGPGPGRPEHAPQMMAVLRAAIERGVPVLGVCLGLQAIGEVAGATVTHAPRQMHGKTSRVDHDGSHSSAAVGTGCRNPVNAGIEDAGAVRDRLGYFGRRHILSLPAEGIADTIDEMEIAGVVPHHQVAGAEPGIARYQYIAQDFLFGLVSVGVALEAPASFACLPDAADGFTGFARHAGNTKAVRGAERNTALGVVSHDGDGKTMGEERRDAADRAWFSLDVEQREIAFGGRIKFQDCGKRKARLESFPDVATQAVAAGEPDPVPAIEFGHRRFKQVPAKLTDILEHLAD